ncbi:MAG: MATE family efflux transporter [Pseudobacteriovorax sp.]|nr:MATE family efflux transporter [Pseudobacteriovorax sp.]
MAKLTQGPINKTIIRLALPMIVGIAASMSYNIVDTYFIGRIGQLELEAVSFTFPVVMSLFQIAIGFGIGITSIVSRSAGKASLTESKQIAFASILLMLAIASFICFLGLATVEPLFKLLGANAGLIPPIKTYLSLMYPAMSIQMVTLVASNIFRAHGDTLRPSMVMIGGALLNIAIDPIFIFGLGPIPAWELWGAALASLVANGIVCLTVMVMLMKARLIELKKLPLSRIKSYWLEITRIGVPAALSNVVNPVAFAIVTAILATYGSEVVAAYGVANLVQSFAVIPLLALTGALSPFIGQNFGAKALDRVVYATKSGFLLSLVWGLGIAIPLYLLGGQIGGLFTENDRTLEVFVLYMTWVPITLGGYGVLIVACSTFNATGRPMPSLVLTVFRMLITYVPFSWLGSEWGGLPGLVIGIALSNIFAGALSQIMVAKLVYLPFKKADQRG